MKLWKGRMLVLGGLLGAAYGLLAYALFAKTQSNVGLSMSSSFSFLALVPIALSAVPLFFSDHDQAIWFRNALFTPWVSLIGMFMLLGTLNIEGALCLLVLLAPFVVFISTGIWLVRAISLSRRKSASRKRKVAAGIALMLLPFLAGTIEHRWFTRAETDDVTAAITVQAAPADVWSQIVEVAPISDRELPAGWLNHLGVPRPRQATVDALRAGGVRTGRFDGGLRFIETMRAYEPEQRLQLEVVVDPTTIGADPSLRHALTGDYFAISTVEYRLEPAAGGATRVSLSCRYALHTSANFYGRAWAGPILRDFEERLLRVVASRAEARAAAAQSIVSVAAASGR